MISTAANGNEYSCHDCSDVEQIADGPKPMRDYKPTKTIPNSADQFWQSHQAEYEARGKQSDDRVQRVQRHNTAFPALRDELERRRSTTKVTAINARGMKLGRICSKCLKRKRSMKKKAFNSRYRSKRNRLRTRKEYRPNRCRREIYKNKRYRFVNHCFQPDTVKKKYKKSRNKHVHRQRESRISEDEESRSDLRSLVDPSSTQPSVSSYHSFPSLDHEPMVS